MKLKNKTVPFMSAGLYKPGYKTDKEVIYFFNKNSGDTYYGWSFVFGRKWHINEKASMQGSRIRANFGKIEDNIIRLKEAIKVVFEGEKSKPLY